MRALEEVRKDIDAADDGILAALGRRFALMDEMRELKSREGLPRVDRARENAILSRVAAAVPPRWRDTACGVWERILSGSGGEIETIARGVCAADGKVLAASPVFQNGVVHTLSANTEGVQNVVLKTTAKGSIDCSHVDFVNTVLIP